MSLGTRAAIANPCLALGRNWGIETRSAVQTDTPAQLWSHRGAGRVLADASREHSFLQRV